ncbi:MAG: hypothetical protein ABSB59_33545 [Streptosporangiaceae bacterium]
MAMDKHNGHFERGHGRPDCLAGQPVACGVHGDADPGGGRQTRNRISGHGRRIGPAGAVPGVAARKITEIAWLAVETA